MESISGKNKIIIGEQIFTKLNSRSKKNFKKIIDSNRWNYYYSHIVYGKNHHSIQFMKVYNRVLYLTKDIRNNLTFNLEFI